jgi:hypothetical protein
MRVAQRCARVLLFMLSGRRDSNPQKSATSLASKASAFANFATPRIDRRVACCGAGSVSPRRQPNSKAARIASWIYFAASGIVVKALSFSSPSPRSQGRSALDTPAPHSHYNGVQAYLFLGWRGGGDLTPSVRIGHNLDVRKRSTLSTRGYALCLCSGSGLKRSESIGNGSC